MYRWRHQLSILCSRSAYLHSPRLCLGIPAVRFAWPRFLPGQRHRPAMPWYRHDFLGSVRWRPRPFPGKIEHCEQRCAVKEGERQFQSYRTRLRTLTHLRTLNSGSRATLFQPGRNFLQIFLKGLAQSCHSEMYQDQRPSKLEFSLGG